MQDKRHRRLYMSLAVFPKGFKFSTHEIAMLLYDLDDHGETAARKRAGEEEKALAESLEGRAVLGRKRDNRYSLHDIHANFMKLSIVNFPEVRRQGVSRWCGHLSTLDVVRSCGLSTLQRLFRAVEPLRENGEGRLTRAYDAALAAQDDADPKRLETLRAASFLYLIGGEYGAVNDLCQVDLTRFEAEIGQGHPDVVNCIMGIGIVAMMAGNTTDATGLLARAVGIFEKAEGMDPLQLAEALHGKWYFLLSQGNISGAENLYKRALQLREDHLGPDNKLMARTLKFLVRCAMPSGLLAKAHELFERALRTKEASLRRGHPDILWTLDQLGLCKLKMGKTAEVSQLLKHVLQVREATLSKDNPDVAYTLLVLGRCAVKLAATAEAEELFTRAFEELKISEVDTAMWRSF